MKTISLVLVALGLSVGMAAASPLEGVWTTPPDQKSQTGRVLIAKCGAGLCGTVTDAFDKAGKPINTIAVGKRVLRDVHPTQLTGGKVYVPTMRKEFPVQVSLNGNTLRLRACNAIGVCQSQTWTRAR